MIARHVMRRSRSSRRCASSCARWRAAGERVAFVPTMGNLHAGHVQPHRAARQHGDRVIVEHLRQSDAVRAERGFRRVSAHARRRLRACSTARARPDVHAGRRRDLSARHEHDARVSTCRASPTSCAASSGPGISMASRPSSRSCSTSCSRTSRCSARRITSSSLSSAAWSRDLCMPRRDRRRADGARERRSRDELAQPLSHGRGARARRRLIYRGSSSARGARIEVGRRRFRRDRSGRARGADSGGIPRRTTSTCATRRTLERPRSRLEATRRADGRAPRQGAADRQLSSARDLS